MKTLTYIFKISQCFEKQDLKNKINLKLKESQNREFSYTMHDFLVFSQDQPEIGSIFLESKGYRKS